MLNIIIGKNSIGKSAYLQNLRKTRENSLSNTDINYLPTYDIIPLDIKMVNEVCLGLGHDTPIKDEARIIVIQNETWSKRYLDALTLICKKTDMLVLDEAEDGLEMVECNRIFTAMYIVSKFKEVWCITHSVDILNFSMYEDVKYWTIDSESGELRIKEIEVDDIEEYNYMI